ncbi:ZIP zinc/iron transport family [Calocera cornea HHB12733]|uniref:ZIP zinc/iron transport family n=1 Tax=Calocera cornea HHB12733 TaxID=1353952 RepID=A0A165EYT9_9BASI|nr:ZIP zinc/iron transport family [Calocera cornea HHB12733]
MSDSSDLQCGATDNEISWFSLRVGSVFIILATSMSGALFPVLARKTKWIHVPKEVFEFAKYFGSGVIIATAFIHLLAPGFDELTSPCLSGIWGDYDWAPAIAMMAVFAVFLVELFAFRWGTAKLRALGVEGYDAHGHCAGPSGAMGAHGPEGTDSVGAPLSAGVARILPSEAELEAGDEHTMTETSGAAQILGVAILEFGVIFHSVIIGLTLAVDENFIQLFIVIIFHQMFEGLGLGARLAFLDLPRAYRWAPLIGCIAYGVVTPIGIAAGLGVRSTYNPGSATASIVSGVLDSTSAGVLLYTGLVELLAHEFLFNPVMTGASNGRVVYAVVCMLVGAGIMALLGRWA